MAGIGTVSEKDSHRVEERNRGTEAVCRENTLDEAFRTSDEAGWTRCMNLRIGASIVEESEASDDSFKSP